MCERIGTRIEMSHRSIRTANTNPTLSLSLSTKSSLNWRVCFVFRVGPSSSSHSSRAIQMSAAILTGRSGRDQDGRSDNWAAHFICVHSSFVPQISQARPDKRASERERWRAFKWSSLSPIGRPEMLQGELVTRGEHKLNTNFGWRMREPWRDAQAAQAD